MPGTTQRRVTCHLISWWLSANKKQAPKTHTQPSHNKTTDIGKELQNVKCCGSVFHLEKCVSSISLSFTVTLTQFRNFWEKRGISPSCTGKCVFFFIEIYQHHPQPAYGELWVALFTYMAGLMAWQARRGRRASRTEKIEVGEKLWRKMRGDPTTFSIIVFFHLIFFLYGMCARLRACVLCFQFQFYIFILSPLPLPVFWSLFPFFHPALILSYYAAI